MDRNDPDIKAMLQTPESMDLGRLSALSRRYPYFPLPSALIERYHRSELSDERLNSLRMHLAVVTGDRKALYYMASDEGNSLAGMYPPETKPDTITTDNALDTFFANYGTMDKAESDLLERLIFNPVPDYSEILAKEENPSRADSIADDDTTSRIDAFLRDRQSTEDDREQPPMHENTDSASEYKPVAHQNPLSSTPQTDDNSLLSESLAKIFIKQGRYERAYEIIYNLSLNYPKKSIYFADQMRFLQKLIKIQQTTKG